MPTIDPKTLAKYRPPWTGVDSSKPANMIDPNAAELIENFILRDGEIRTRPVLNPPAYIRKNAMAGTAPGNTGSTSILANNGQIKVLNQQINPGSGSFYPYLIDNKSAWAFDLGTQVWVKVADLSELVGITTPLIAGLSLNGLVYFCTFTTGKLYQMNVPAQTIVNPASIIAGGFFLGELAQHLVMVATTEGGVFMPSRVRWSGVGNPTEFDPAVDLTAGFNDLLDVPDTITGFATIGKTGYVFRSNGITEMIPTGQGANPFDFEHISNANNTGVGNYYPLSLASWGAFSCFVSADDIYMISSQGLQGIGGRARDAIFADIADFTNSTMFAGPGSPSVDLIGSIIPMMRRTYTYPMYILAIPVFRRQNVVNNSVTTNIANTTIFWIYSVEDQSWTRWVSNQGIVIAKINFLTAGTTTDCSSKKQFVCVPMWLNIGKPYVGYFALDDVPCSYKNGLANVSFNTEEDCIYKFRIEEIDTDKKATVHRLRVLYRDLGIVKATFRVETTGEKPSFSEKTETLGTKYADGKIKIARPSVLITGELPQVSIVRKAGDGPLSIIGVDIVGLGDEGETL